MTGRILFVDDDKSLLEAIKVKHSRLFNISIAQGAQEGLRMIKSEGPFSVVVSDLRMPGIDGLSFLSLVQRHAPESLRIVFSGHADLQTALTVINSGLAFRFLEKPCPSQRLAAVLSEAVEKYEAQAQDRGERQAIRIMAHDIKGPLISITGIVSMMLDEPDLAPICVDSITAIQKSCAKALRMINASAVISAIERETYVPAEEPFNMEELLADSLRELQPLAKGKGLVIETHFSANETRTTGMFNILGDRFLMECVLDNLLRNAVEACPMHGNVEIHARISDSLSISIRNSGEVADCVRERFFDRYVTHGKPYGTGLGTYSAKIMTSSLRGTISLDTSETGYTRIVVTIPLRPGMSGDTPRSCAASAGPRQER